MYKHLYQRFLQAHPTSLHFACHSHHYWPDCTRDAHLKYWDDSCKYVDEKWEYFFSGPLKETQELIAAELKVTQAEQIVFAPNTHELVFRLLTSLDWKKDKIKILTTDSEFYSFDRQINRLAEMPQFEVQKVPTLPFDTFHERFEQELARETWDMVFFSQVFFNSGLVCDIHRLTTKVPSGTAVVIDGYHGFLALPLDFSTLQDRAFYLAGSYKYAQGGEGACFLYVPTGTAHRPLYTGWFAELAQLNSVNGEVGYPENALQYAGSTMDFSGVYRLRSVLTLFMEKEITTEKIHQHILTNQQLFLAELNKAHHPVFNEKNLIKKAGALHGHFLTFTLRDTEATKKTVHLLSQAGLRTDSRGNKIRFGFGLYQNHEDVKRAVQIICSTIVS